MRAISLLRNNDLRKTKVFDSRKKVQQFRVGLEQRTEAKFKQIDHAKTQSLDAARKKFID